jgi:hypothetical protein
MSQHVHLFSRHAHGEVEFLNVLRLAGCVIRGVQATEKQRHETQHEQRTGPQQRVQRYVRRAPRMPRDGGESTRHGPGGGSSEVAGESLAGRELEVAGGVAGMLEALWTRALQHTSGNRDVLERE